MKCVDRNMGSAGAEDPNVQSSDRIKQIIQDEEKGYNNIKNMLEKQMLNADIKNELSPEQVQGIDLDS